MGYIWSIRSQIHEPTWKRQNFYYSVTFFPFNHIQELGDWTYGYVNIYNTLNFMKKYDFNSKFLNLYRLLKIIKGKQITENKKFLFS